MPKQAFYSRLYVISWLREHGGDELADFLAEPPRTRRTRTYTAPAPSQSRRWHSELHNAEGVSRYCRNGSHWACMGRVGHKGERCLCPVCNHIARPE